MNQTSLDKNKEFNQEAIDFISILNEWLHAINDKSWYPEMSDYVQSKNRNNYYASVSFYAPENNNIVYNFSIAGIKLSRAKPYINVFNNSIVFKTYKSYIDLSLNTENKERNDEIKELTIDLKKDTINGVKCVGKIIPMYLDKIIECLSIPSS